mmetsp:Transcript_31491/g.57718  ORF Transcript_31491/g.57718 Transcript_31491/m.57718 type:complete len:221 (-) Transcript_31491:4581-5243(-)
MSEATEFVQSHRCLGTQSTTGSYPLDPVSREMVNLHYIFGKFCQSYTDFRSPQHVWPQVSARPQHVWPHQVWPVPQPVLLHWQLPMPEEPVLFLFLPLQEPVLLPLPQPVLLPLQQPSQQVFWPPIRPSSWRVVCTQQSFQAQPLSPAPWQPQWKPNLLFSELQQLQGVLGTAGLRSLPASAWQHVETSPARLSPYPSRCSGAPTGRSSPVHHGEECRLD